MTFNLQSTLETNVQKWDLNAESSERFSEQEDKITVLIVQ